MANANMTFETATTTLAAQVPALRNFMANKVEGLFVTKVAPNAQVTNWCAEWKELSALGCDAMFKFFGETGKSLTNPDSDGRILGRFQRERALSAQDIEGMNFLYSIIGYVTDIHELGEEDERSEDIEFAINAGRSVGNLLWIRERALRKDTAASRQARKANAQSTAPMTLKERLAAKKAKVAAKKANGKAAAQGARMFDLASMLPSVGRPSQTADVTAEDLDLLDD